MVNRDRNGTHDAGVWRYRLVWIVMIYILFFYLTVLYEAQYKHREEGRGMKEEGRDIDINYTSLDPA